jgi:hypothetical protein
MYRYDEEAKIKDKKTRFREAIINSRRDQNQR